MEQIRPLRLKNPTHPGDFVKTEVIDPSGLSVIDAVRILDIGRVALLTFLNERSALSTEMAIRIEKAFGLSMKTFTRMQNSFDISQAHSQKLD